MKKRVDRTITVEGQEIAFYVIRPTNETIRNADRFRTKIWTECTDDKIPTKKQLSQIMLKNGSWSDQKAQQEIDITRDILKLEKELYGGPSDRRKKPKLSDGRKKAIEIRRLRLQLRDLIAERISLEENSAENLADNARFDYLVAHSTFYQDGRRVYKDFNDYNNRSADDLAFAAAQIIAEMVYNIDAEFEKHRMLSSNSSSSRAIPFKNLEETPVLNFISSNTSLRIFLSVFGFANCFATTSLNSIIFLEK